MSDVARHAGVSQRTVSNVVNDFPHVAPATRARVEASLRALGYRPNLAARQLRRGRTGTVTLAVPDLAERYFADLANAVIRAATASGIRVLIEPTRGDHAAELELLSGGGHLLTDGLIMNAVALGPSDEPAERPPQPIVLVGDREAGGLVDHVGIQNRPAARAAVEHLIAQGRRRIALLGAGQGAAGASQELRQGGYRDALEAAGIAVDEALLIPSEWSWAGGEQLVAGLLASGDPMPDALFTMNDSLGLGAVRGLVRAGVRVPEDVAVVGFDDIMESRFATPSLSSVSPSLDLIATTALELLADQQEDPSPGRAAQHRHIDFELRIRESSATS